MKCLENQPKKPCLSPPSLIKLDMYPGTYSEILPDKLTHQTGSACEMLATNASPVCPERVRPLLSTIVPETTIVRIKKSNF